MPLDCSPLTCLCCFLTSDYPDSRKQASTGETEPHLQPWRTPDCSLPDTASSLPRASRSPRLPLQEHSHRHGLRASLFNWRLMESRLKWSRARLLFRWVSSSYSFLCLASVKASHTDPSFCRCCSSPSGMRSCRCYHPSLLLVSLLWCRSSTPRSSRLSCFHLPPATTDSPSLETVACVS